VEGSHRGRRPTPAKLKRGKDGVAVSTRADGGVHSAFGETKTLTEWASDPRCKVGADALRAHLQQGLALEEALIASRRYHDILYEAFGDAKTLVQWAADPRCKVSRATLSRRIHGGMPFEEALGTEALPRAERGRVAVERIEGFGERKNLEKERMTTQSPQTNQVCLLHQLFLQLPEEFSHEPDVSRSRSDVARDSFLERR